jgi:HD-GYP domain-containing protein (c-di-GMP phosphodiesterase class II)
MPIIDVKQLAAGSRLAEDVHTMLGGILFSKGTPIYEKEMEILQAFLINEVHVEEDEPYRLDKKDGRSREKNKENKPADTQPSMGKKDFNEKYEKAVSAFKKLMIRVRGGQNIPVMEVRQSILPLLEYVQQQPHVLLSFRRIHHVDSYAYEHSIAVGLISYVIAKWMKVPEKEWMQIALAGTLMDVGKIKIDRKILQKPGKLTAEEFEEMKKHTVYGYHMIKASPGLSEGVALAALQHHEREDGSGYPLGLPGSKLHLYSKIVAVADVYHAMSSDRVYKKAASPYIVAEQLLMDSFGKLDPAIVQTFVNGITQFAVGTVVELSDGSFAKIVFTDRNHPTRPLVETNGKMINLAEARHLSIVRVM